MTDTSLGGILSYFGAKRTLAPQIVAHFGEHEFYAEPFAGSLSVLLEKQPCRNEVVSEKHPDVANLIRCLANDVMAESLWRMAECHPVSECLYQQAAERLSAPHPPLKSGYDLSRAFDFLLVSWQGLSGVAGTNRKPKFAVRNTSSGGSVAARWRSVAPSIPAWHERLRNVEFRHRDAFELIESVPDRDGVVLYIDSPYCSSARTGGEYQFDFSSEDHIRLAQSLRRFKRSRIVVSHAGCQETDDLYHGWRKIELVAKKKMGQHESGGSGGKLANEVLYVNDA